MRRRQIEQLPDNLVIHVWSSVYDRALAEDLFQETLLVAWRRLGDFDRRRPFGPWLRGIAGRLVLDAGKRRARGPVVDDERVLQLIDRRCSVLHRARGDDFEDRLASLELCLEQLPERMRSAVDLRYGEDARGDELARRLTTTAANARKLLQRARARLADCLERRLGGWSPAP